MTIKNSETKGQLLDEYTTALTDYFKSAGEAPLERAYDLGRRCLAIHEMGIEDVLEVHQMAVRQAAKAALPDKDHGAISERAARFLAESLAPFEMAHRAYREQARQRTAEIEALNRLFQRHLIERSATLQKYREVVGTLQNLAQDITGILDVVQTPDVPDLRVKEGIDAILGDPGRAQQ